MSPPYLALTALYCAGIFYLSSQSDPDAVAPSWMTFPGADKLGHFIIYAGLAAVVSVGFRRSNEALAYAQQFWLPVAFAAGYGVTDEIHQLFVPLRAFDLADLAADALGALAIQVVLCHYVWNVRSALHDNDPEKDEA